MLRKNFYLYVSVLVEKEFFLYFQFIPNFIIIQLEPPFSKPLFAYFETRSDADVASLGLIKTSCSFACNSLQSAWRMDLLSLRSDMSSCDE